MQCQQFYTKLQYKHYVFILYSLNITKLILNELHKIISCETLANVSLLYSTCYLICTNIKHLYSIYNMSKQEQLTKILLFIDGPIICRVSVLCFYIMQMARCKKMFYFYKTYRFFLNGFITYLHLWLCDEIDELKLKRGNQHKINIGCLILAYVY
jgi:hypothetical protein